MSSIHTVAAARGILPLGSPTSLAVYLSTLQSRGDWMGPMGMGDSVGMSVSMGVSVVVVVVQTAVV